MTNLFPKMLPLLDWPRAPCFVGATCRHWQARRRAAYPLIPTCSPSWWSTALVDVNYPDTPAKIIVVNQTVRIKQRGQQ
jgi:hypothetical protein